VFGLTEAAMKVLAEVFNAVDVRADRCLGEVEALQLL
jgi:hypothetical protein